MIRKSKESNVTTSTSNRILQGTSIDGNVTSEGDFRVDGEIHGNITITGKLVIGEKGHVKGEVKCGSARVSGRLEGIMTVEDLLNLEASARVSGDIFTSKLAIEPGAEFSGSCKMGAVVREIQNNDSTKKERRSEKIS
jgi:cytoskeletal protein CcmA (bactofilin family)